MQCIRYLLTSRKPNIQVLHDILIWPNIPMKLVRLIKMCLNETYMKVQVGRHLSDLFPSKNGLIQ